MARKYSSTSVETTLASGINTTQTTITLPSGAATQLLGGQTLVPADNDIFTVAIEPDTTSEEVVFVTDVSGDTLTISRGQAGTGTAGVSGIAHGAGATVRHVLTSSDLDFFRNGVATADGAIAKSLVDAKGDIVTATANNTPARLAVGGSNGQALTVDSSTSTGLAWATISSAPKIGQIVTATTSNTTTTTSSSYQNITNFTATITPTSATSKIYIVCDFQAQVQALMGINSGGLVTVAYFALTKGTSTVIYEPGNLTFFSSSAGANDLTMVTRSSLTFVDSPNTTSATTYKLQVKSNGASVNATAGNGTITLMEVLV
jgi:hypothetical protein